MSLEDVIGEEPDEAFSEEGLNAATWLEGFASCDLPSWGYSLSGQTSDAWSVERRDVSHEVKFSGTLNISFDGAI